MNKIYGKRLKELSWHSFGIKKLIFKKAANWDPTFIYLNENVAPVIWNALPFNVRNAKSLESFKSGLKTYLFSSFFDKLFSYPLPYISLCASEYVTR